MNVAFLDVPIWEFGLFLKQCDDCFILPKKTLRPYPDSTLLIEQKGLLLEFIASLIARWDGDDTKFSAFWKRWFFYID